MTKPIVYDFPFPICLRPINLSNKELTMSAKMTSADARIHIPQLILNHQVHKDVHGDNFLGRINTRLAVGITKIVGSMWCAYVFALLALVSLPAAIHSHDRIIIVAWIAQTFLQLVLLPIIIVGQNVLAAAADKRSEATITTPMPCFTKPSRSRSNLAAPAARATTDAAPSP